MINLQKWNIANTGERIGDVVYLSTKILVVNNLPETTKDAVHRLTKAPANQ